MTKILTLEQNKEISKLYEEGFNTIQLSEKYNISKWSISNSLKKTKNKTRIRTYECDENYFNIVDTKEKSYWLGLLFADGYVRNRVINKCKRGSVVGISLKKGDEYILEKFIKDLKSNYKLKETRKNNYINYKLEINSVKMAKDLISYGCVPKKSLVLNPPKINKELYCHFIRGYIDGDGSIGNYKNRLKLSILGTYNILDWILEIFKSIGIVKIPKICLKNKIHSIQFNSKDDINLIKKYLYNDSDDYYLIRKKEKFNL